MYADLGADAGAALPGLRNHFYLVGGADVEHVQAGAVFLSHFHCLGGGQDAGLAAADQGMGAEGNGVVAVAGAGGGQVAAYRGLVLAVGGYQPAGEGEYGLKGLLRVH